MLFISSGRVCSGNNNNLLLWLWWCLFSCRPSGLVVRLVIHDNIAQNIIRVILLIKKAEISVGNIISSIVIVLHVFKQLVNRGICCLGLLSIHIHGILN